jgi:hypothetical protein
MISMANIAVSMARVASAITVGLGSVDKRTDADGSGEDIVGHHARARDGQHLYEWSSYLARLWM